MKLYAIIDTYPHNSKYRYIGFSIKRISKSKESLLYDLRSKYNYRDFYTTIIKRGVTNQETVHTEEITHFQTEYVESKQTTTYFEQSQRNDNNIMGPYLHVLQIHEFDTDKVLPAEVNKPDVDFSLVKYYYQRYFFEQFEDYYHEIDDDYHVTIGGDFGDEG